MKGNDTLLSSIETPKISRMEIGEIYSNSVARYWEMDAINVLLYRFNSIRGKNFSRLLLASVCVGTWADWQVPPAGGSSTSTIAVLAAYDNESPQLISVQSSSVQRALVFQRCNACNSSFWKRHSYFLWTLLPAEYSFLSVCQPSFSENYIVTLQLCEGKIQIL